jgi:hypothetical protein
MTIDKAKEIYCDIISAINEIEKSYDIYIGIPSFIELDGWIYQHYHCLAQEELFKWGQKGGKQMKDVMDGNVKFYTTEKE